MQQKRFLRILMVALTVVVFSLTLLSSASSAECQRIYHFDWGGDGKHPYASLILDAAGNLYGTTANGGDGDERGTVFKLPPNQDYYSFIYSFSFKGKKDGRHPYAGLILDAAGNLYGTTTKGGLSSCRHGCGTVFKLTPNPDGSWTESVLYSFQGRKDGTIPYAGLILDPAGSLYGTTAYGGAYNGGTVFKLTPKPDGSWTESLLHSFRGRHGKHPHGSLIFDANGVLYGTTSLGGDLDKGTVFKLAPKPDGSWTESVLYSFKGGKDGLYPYAGLIFDTAGNLYGTTVGALGHGNGTVFKLTPNPDGSWSESPLHRFQGEDGAHPYAGLLIDADGNLYGTTAFGGRDGRNGGTVFKLTLQPDGHWKRTTVHQFQNTGWNPSRGLHPFAGLVMDSAGNLYGTTAEGGKSLGTVFKCER